MKKGMVGVVAAVSGALAGALGIGRVLGKQLSKDRDLRDKHMALFQMMIQWVKVKQSGKNLSSYFEQEGFKEIAIYGMHFAGEILEYMGLILISNMELIEMQIRFMRISIL